MQCTICGGPLETTGGGAFGRCQQCGNIFSTSGGSPTPIVVVAPGESSEEAHARVFSGQRQVPTQQPDNPMARMIRRAVIGLLVSILVIVAVIVVTTIRSATSTPNRRPTRGGR